MSALKILTTVREALDDPARWSQDGFYVDKDGHRVALFDRGRAYAACLRGAVLLADERGRAHSAAIRLLEDAAERSVIDFNDDPATTHADVLALLDRAIELAKADEQVAA